jgi:hypothetical protein
MEIFVLLPGYTTWLVMVGSIVTDTQIAVDREDTG